MSTELQSKIAWWKQLLLDMGKRNRLINFTEGKRNNIKITAPDIKDLYTRLVTKEEPLKFPYATNLKIDETGEETYTKVIEGDLKSDKTYSDLSKTLKNLRNKAKLSIEEQGINTLYLTFGILKWYESDNSNTPQRSPLILVPVQLVYKTLKSPFSLKLIDDEIVVNPTLAHKLYNDFNFTLPEYDSSCDNALSYLNSLKSELQDDKWDVEDDIHLTNLSFLKINMYKDLEQNEDRLSANKIVSTLCGESSAMSFAVNPATFNHDENEKPSEIFQVVDADSSQQDAILLSKYGESFVLQGPPGTGKSQTITNIIAEAIADGKKVLFVSEKMAALQVVYNRLKSVGLGEFCLNLHSHHTKKTEILQELNRSLYSDYQQNQIYNSEQLARLEQKRKALNQYRDEIHTPCTKLNRTIFEVYGILAKLNGSLNINFAIPDIDEFTAEKLCYNEELIKNFGNTLQKCTVKPDENPWRAFSSIELSNATKQNLESYLDILLLNLEPLNTTLTQILQFLNATQCAEHLSSICAAQKIVTLLSHLAQNITISPEWLDNNELANLPQQCDGFHQQTNTISKLKKDICKEFVDDIFDISIDELNSFITLKEKLQTVIKLEAKINQLDELQQTINNKLTDLDELFNAASDLSQKIPELDAPTSIAELSDFAQTIYSIHYIIDFNPAKSWFNPTTLEKIRHELSHYKDLHKQQQEVEQELLSHYDKRILDLDYKPLLYRFRTEYQPCWRVFNKQFYADKNTLRGLSTLGLKLNRKDALVILNKLQQCHEASDEITQNQGLFKEYLGERYIGHSTNWDNIAKALDVFPLYLDRFQKVPTNIIDKVIRNEISFDIVDAFCKLCDEKNIEKTFSKLSSFSTIRIDCKDDFSEIRAHYLDIRRTIVAFNQILQKLQSLNKTQCDFSTLATGISRIAEYYANVQDFNSKIDTSILKPLYQGLDTPWDKIKQKLEYTLKLKQILKEIQLPCDYIYNNCNNPDFKSTCAQFNTQLVDLLNKVNPALIQFSNYFHKAEYLSQSTNLATLSTTIKRFHESKNLLIEWIDYRKAKQQCADSGLAEFIKRVTVQTNNPTQILNAYKQRFYKLWLDAVLPKFPAVANFKGYNHEDIIKEFCQLDKSQFEIAQLRVKNLVINRIADIQTDHDTINEVSILKKEFKKHRKQLPLRKLFGATSHVVTTLRPCFLLSPLSVSIFLDADKYHFDLVIFDEASQVHTEDAIGAIMRGEQAIIVGDSKQLPPTSFFVASLNDEVYDTDETTEQSYNDAGAFESILDEAATVLPACSLKWHYRSRHEHLIAFSNHTIYDNSLITFPSSTDHAKDLGVEYIYVENGIYDRGGKKNNLKEAQKVAQLVFEHFKNYPNRSLGVVTFSEAQQDAIETAIRQKRLESPSFDTYFSESREDPFFIKNLENVQGDERDTIIFSIGYAKDNHGIMYMNFGPLSRDGGYRRLNVAITRAKYNVKLVGSIQPSDIKLDKVNSKGVQLLRSYIEFAQQGLSAIENAPITHKEIQFDSPFEESVYQFLKQNNFDVRTQIGCSRFRIDLAIVNPNDSGKYVLGIECDGATYHSARTARERDRLRQTALEDMGWKIYRIWSTDWINNTKSEQNRLLNAVNSALIKAKEDEQPFAGAKETTSTKSSAKTKSGQSTKSKTAPTSDGNGLFGAIDF